MNVKEVNNSLVQMLFGKNANNAQSGSETAEAPKFANLVAGAAFSPDALIRPQAEFAGNAADKKPSAALDSSLTAAAKDKPETARKEDKPAHVQKEDAPARDKPAKNVRRKDKEAPDAVAAEAAPEAKTPAAAAQASQGDEAVSDAENTGSQVVQPREGAQPQTRELTATLVGADAPQVMASMNGAELVLMPQALDLAALAALPEVAVIDQSGEIITMSGAEFAAKVQEASAAGQLFVAGEQTVGKMMTVIPAEVVAGFENSLAQDNINSDAAVSAEDLLAVVDEKTAEQAQVLDSKLKDGQKLKVNVDVKEEKFAYADGAEPLQDKAVVDEAVSAVFKNKGSTSSESKISAYNSSAAAQLQQTQGNPANVVPGVSAAVMPGTDAAVQTGAENIRNAAVENITAHNPAHAAANGAAAAQVLKPEIAAKTEETSFRDVYKGMGRDAVEQVKVNITKSAVKGVDKIEIQLKPEDLGHVHVKMQISKDGKLQAEIIASRQETLDILQKEADTLQKAFNEAGFDTDGGSFSFSFRGEEEQNQNSELRNFIGNVLEQESDGELVSNDNQIWDPAQGLNIRV